MSNNNSISDDGASIGHYVYIYRDDRERVRYIGYGRMSGRASSHLTGSHNAQMNEFIAARKYRIEIAGPFESERTGHAVETALISALRPDFNVIHGEGRWRFRPLGVPEKFADRQIEPELHISDFLTVQDVAPTPVIFVIITDGTFDDGRVGFDPANPPSDAQIQCRIERWWQLQRFLPIWAANPSASPGLLVGVFGSPGRQMVIAAARVDRANWARAVLTTGGRIRVPLIDPVNLDTFSLRGRRIARDAGLMFGGIPAQFYIVLGIDGIPVGGNHLRR